MGALDIGARGGAHAPLREIAPVVNFVGFEPDAEECARLNTARPREFRSAAYLPYALGATSGASTLHLCRSGGASSVRPPNRVLLNRFPDAGRFDVIATTPMTTRTLDDLRSDAAAAIPPYVGFIKIDTQGSELDILRGARRMLKEAAAVELEVEFAPLYEGQPLFRDVDAFMAECGFSLFKLRRMNWVRRGSADAATRTAGQLVFGDALYLRDPLPGGNSAPVTGPQQAEALILLACIYDCHDFASELAGDAAIATLIDARAVLEFIDRRMRGSAPNGLWKRRADRLGVTSWLHGYARSWARGDLDFYSRL